jgi:hypothetical protein
MLLARMSRLSLRPLKHLVAVLAVALNVPEALAADWASWPFASDSPLRCWL